ncbi:serine protease [Burkholderia cepacia]|nr:serine protease [Burkholderia cepacia]
MQDITGHYAIPLAHPFSDVPPPYGRRRRPFVASRRARQHVFDIYGPVPARDAGSIARAARPVKAVRAADFGSDNRAWVHPHPLRRRWRLTLMACALFGVACVVATHWVDERQHDAVRGDVYEAAISTAPAPVAARVAAEVAQATGRPAEVAAVRVGPGESGKPGKSVGKDVVAAADAASVESRALLAARDASASEPVAVAVAIASDAAVAQATVSASTSKARRESAANDAVATKATTARSVAKAVSASRGKPARSETSVAHAPPKAAAAASVVDAPAAAPAPSAAQAVGMTAAEFTHWLAATREASSNAGAGSADLTVDLPGHTRLTGQ